MKIATKGFEISSTISKGNPCTPKFQFDTDDDLEISYSGNRKNSAPYKLDIRVFSIEIKIVLSFYKDQPKQIVRLGSDQLNKINYEDKRLLDYYISHDYPDIPFDKTCFKLNDQQLQEKTSRKTHISQNTTSPPGSRE